MVCDAPLLDDLSVSDDVEVPSLENLAGGFAHYHQHNPLQLPGLQPLCNIEFQRHKTNQHKTSSHSATFISRAIKEGEIYLRWVGGNRPESWEVRLAMKFFTPSSCVSSMVSPYFFTLVKLSSGYTARL